MRGRILIGLVVAAVVAGGCSAPPPAPGGAPRVAIVMSGQANDHSFYQMGAAPIDKLTKDGVIAGQISASIPVTQGKATLRQFAEAGYDLVIGWGLDYWDAVRETAAEFPQTKFLATGGADVLTKHTANMETWTYSTAELGYLLGYAAGLTQLSPVAIVDGPQAPFLDEQWAGFGQGLKAANPGALVMPPVYTGDFANQEKARQATAAQIGAGAKLVATNSEGYSAGVAAAARAGKVATIGMAKATSDDAAVVNVAWAFLDMAPIFAGMLDRLKAGKFGGQGTTSSIGNKSVSLTDINMVAAAPATPPDLQQRVAELAGKLAAGQISVPAPTPR